MSTRLELQESEMKKRMEGASAQIMEANNRYFERECKRAGINPKLGFSPELKKQLGA